MAEDITITRWLLDVRNLWAGQDLKIAAKDLLEVITAAEQQQVLNKYHRQDACMSLGSALIKRAYIAKCTGLPWREIKLSRKLDARLGKPCWTAPDQNPSDRTNWPVIDFNVSHQKGLVALIGICVRRAKSTSADDVQVAVDIVSPNERNDMGTIATSGLAEFINTFADILSPQEAFALTYSLAPETVISLHSGEQVTAAQLGRLDRTTETGKELAITTSSGTTHTFDSELIIDEKLRAFYACFSLKESFVKLGGEGLAADWIQQCEFHNVRAPAKGAVPRCSLAGVFGEKIVNSLPAQEHSAFNGSGSNSFQITLHDKDVVDVSAEIQAYEEDYLISSMVKPAEALVGQSFTEWQRIDLEKDIFPLIQR